MITKKKVPLFSPFRYPDYRNLCIANFIANIGAWIQIFASGWLIASQTKDPSISVMSQTMTQIPIFIFSMIGGVISDRMNHFRYLYMINISIFILVLILGLVTMFYSPQVNYILIFTFLIASGTALKTSSWQASMSTLVNSDEIESSATLNGLSYNLASIIGPLIGTLILLLSQPGVLYLANAACLLSLIFICYNMKKIKTHKTKAYNMQIIDSLTQGISECYKNKSFRHLTIIIIFLFFPISAFQSLLPIYVTNTLSRGSVFLGYLMCNFGSGAVISAFFMPSIRSRLLRHNILTLFSLTLGWCFIVLSFKPPLMFIIPTVFIAGFVWAGIVSTSNSIAQSCFNKEIRSRALSIYSMFFYGALTLGSITWGRIASLLNIQSSFLCTGSLLISTSAYILLLNRKAVRI